ncbi:MAG: hypothetical protein IPQ07_39275 [Myxococcales bacterium]|nr:hypothetical protein [Myxococcales bacterium]
MVSGAAIAAHKRLSISGRRLVWSDCTEYLSLTIAKLLPSGATKFDDLARNKWQDFAPVAVPGTDDLVFISYRSTKDEVWRMGHGGENARVVPFGGLALDRLALSHDGRTLAAANDDGLFVGPLDGSTPPRKVVGGEDGEHNATFTRDGKRLIFERRDSERDRIAMVTLAGGDPAWLLPAPSLAPAQSPTDDVLAYLIDDPAKAPPSRVVMLLDQRTGKTRPLAPTYPSYPFRDLRWAPDGKRLLAIRRDGALVEFEAATGAVLRTLDVGAEQLFGATYVGDEIFVGHAASAGDIWEAELREP